MLKVSENPPILSPWVQSLTELSGDWWVAHTKARNEKAFAWDLHNLRIGYFLPLYRRIKISGGKKRRVLMPLFPSYVFFCGDAEARYRALTTGRLCQTIEVIDREEFVRELSQFERVLAHEPHLQPYPSTPVGRACRITSGVLRGVEGVVVKVGRASKVFLKVNVLARGALLEIDSDLVEVIC